MKYLATTLSLFLSLDQDKCPNGADKMFGLQPNQILGLLTKTDWLSYSSIAKVTGVVKKKDVAKNQEMLTG